MASKFCLIINTSEDQKTTNDQLTTAPTAGSPRGGNADAWGYMSDVSSYFADAAVGSKSLNVIYTDGLAYATGTVTFAGDVSNNDTLTIGGVTITFVTGTPNANQVKCGVSQAATQTALTTYINSSSRLVGMVTASNSGSVVTLQAAYPGLIGNAIVVTKSAANLTVTSPLSGGSTTTYSAAISAGL